MYKKPHGPLDTVALPDGQPTKDILPITLRAGDGSAQPGELPENGRNLVSHPKIPDLRSTSCSTVSIGFSIDPAEGVEPVIHLKPTEFLGKIIIQESKTAI